ncbi:hypothetical protein B7990_06315 [Fibrobacter sp. UWB4]|nr:hypothetical protein B7990_06315 [Fibrobacter sp. UWB4]
MDALVLLRSSLMNFPSMFTIMDEFVKRRGQIFCVLVLAISADVKKLMAITVFFVIRNIKLK